MKHAAMAMAVWAIVVGPGLARGQGESRTQAAEAETATSPAVMLERGIFTEETLGDLDAAIEIYRKIVGEAEANRQYAAKAQYRLAMCYLKKGDKPAAVSKLTSLVEMYPDHRGVVSPARRELARLVPPMGDVPRIVETTPEPLSNDVDPSLDKITVTFDRPMVDGSWSWTGGGETFPQITGKISYDQTRMTCTLPVKLQPGKVYWVGINSPSHRNFQTPDGTPARWYIVLFATRGSDGKPTPLPEDIATRAKKINAAAQASAAQVRPGDGASQEALLAQAREVGRRLLELLKGGQVEEAFSLATADYRRTHPKSFVELAERLDFSKASVSDVLASHDSACVVLSGLAIKGRDESLSMGLGLRRHDSRLLIRDVDALPNEAAKKDFIAGFQKSLFAAKPMRREYVDPTYLRSAEVLSAEGWQLWRKQKLPEAEAKFEIAVTLDPTNANAWNGLGWARFNQGKRTAAKEAFQKAVAIDPATAGSWNGLGWVSKTAGNTDEAIENWKMAIAAAPGATAALNGLASAYMERGRYEEAIEAYKQWLKADPGNKDAKAGLEKAQTALQAVREAKQAARNWLKLVDAGSHEQSWSAAAEIVRRQVSQDAWTKQVRAASGPLGAVKSRTVRSAIYTTALPGAPDGQYVVIQYDTAFENKAQAVETVTPMKAKDGTWRVSGYYIK